MRAMKNIPSLETERSLVEIDIDTAIRRLSRLDAEQDAAWKMDFRQNGVLSHRYAVDVKYKKIDQKIRNLQQQNKNYKNHITHIGEKGSRSRKEVILSTDPKVGTYVKKV